MARGNGSPESTSKPRSSRRVRAADVAVVEPTNHGGAPLPVSAAARPQPSHDEISARAFELFLERGGEHGHDEEDWLRAETELRGNGK